MSYFKKLYRQNIYVTVSHLVISLFGVFTFPVWTRIFNKNEYGILSLITTTIIFLGSLSKFGLQHAATRYYSEFNQNKRRLSISYYYTTLFLSSIAFGLILCIIFIFLVNQQVLPLYGIPLYLVVLTALISFASGIKEFTNSILLVEQNAKLLSITSIVGRCGQFFLSLFLVIYFVGGIYGYFIGYAVVEILIFIILLFPYFQNKKIQFQNFSPPFLLEALKYGFPLLGFELSRTVLSIGDRYIINYFLDSTALGIYSAGYNMCLYIIGIITNPMRMTIMPMFLEIWEKEGTEKTTEFLSRVLNYYFLIIIPIFFGLSYLKNEIIIFVASDKYKDASVLSLTDLYI